MRAHTLAGLDIGTTKTCAVVAATGPSGLEIIGVGEAPSTGLRRGVVTDLEETVKAIEAATERAERMAGVQISHVYVGVTGEHIASTNNRGIVAVSSDEREVVPGDVRRVLDASKIINLAADRQIIHALPRHYTIDGHDGVTDPVWKSRRTSSPEVRRSSPTCSNVSREQGSSRPVSCSSRWRRRRQRCFPKRSTSASCCSTSAGARPISPFTSAAA